MRTIVVSDLHGQRRLLDNALEHCNFNQDDTLVVAGDTCDIGNETMQIHEELFELGAIQLVGNHEISHLCRIDIRPYDHSLDPDYIAFIALGITTDNMKMMHAVDGVLISHAGLSKKLAIKGFTENGSEDTNMKIHHESGTLTAAVAANHFNERLKSRVRIEMLEHDDGEHPMLYVDRDSMWTDWFYPFWFRPYNDPDWGPVAECGMYDGFKQVVGHTPIGSFSNKQQRLIYSSGTTMIDPYSRGNFDKRGYCKYAIIENGEVSLHGTNYSY